LRILIGTLLALSLLPARAFPDDIVDIGFGLWDKKTNLEWLDMSLPAPCSLEQLNAAAPGCAFFAEGWQLATMDMVRTLVANTGFPLGASPADAGAIAFIQALGPTNVVVDGGNPDLLVTEVWGITADPGTSSFYQSAYVAWFESQSGQGSFSGYGEIDNIGHVYNPEGPGDTVVSYWLARTHVPAVPEPGTWLMATTGVLGLLGWRRRQLKSGAASA
jgi:hypothetical protein